MQRHAEKQKRYAKWDKLIIRLRRRIFDYWEESEEKGEKASRILSRAIAKKVANRVSETDQWGATSEDRRLLARHGIAWGD